MIPYAGERGLESGGSCGLLEYIVVYGLPVVVVPVVGKWGRLGGGECDCAHARHAGKLVWALRLVFKQSLRVSQMAETAETSNRLQEQIRFPRYMAVKLRSVHGVFSLVWIRWGFP